MTMAAGVLIIPAALVGTHVTAPNDNLKQVVILSRGSAVLLLIVFIVYLNFRLRSHVNQFEDYRFQRRHRHDSIDKRIVIASSLFGILLCILLAIFCAESIVRTLDSIVEAGYLQKRFIGMILLPLTAEGSERLRAVKLAYQEQMDAALEFAIGRSMQIALFVSPTAVLCGWAMRTPNPMTLDFGIVETTALFLSVLLVIELVRDGKTNYLEGTICITT